MKTNNKTTLSFTKEELDILMSALNTYSLEQINMSKTWATGVFGAKRDVWHRNADDADNLFCRAYKGVKRLNK